VIRRGEVWVGNLNPTPGAEIGKIRPVVLLQADELTAAGCETVIVLPLTTQARSGMHRFRVELKARGRLLKDCFVVMEKPRTLDRSRLGEGPLAVLTGEEMAAVERSLKAVLGLR